MRDGVFRLSVAPAPRWIDLMPGVRVLVRPMTNGLWLAAKADDAVIAAALLSRGEFVGALTVAAARLAVLDWEGVGDVDGVPIRPTPEAVGALIDQSRQAYEAFHAGYLEPWFMVVAEGNGSAAGPTGGSAAAPSTAPDAPAAVTDAPSASTGR